MKDITASPAKNMVETIVREILFLSSFHHDHIVSYLGTELHDSTISIFTEFMPGGSLADLITSFGVLPDQLTARYIRQVTVELSQPPRCRLRESTLRIRRDVGHGTLWRTLPPRPPPSAPKAFRPGVNKAM